MEKEQKKLLLVAVSVGVFLLITVAVATILLTQKTQPQPHEAVFSSSAANVGQGQVYLTETPANTSTSVTINCEDPEITVGVDKNNGDHLTIQIPKPATAAVPDSPEIVAITPVRTTPPPATSAPANVRPAQTRPAQTTARSVTKPAAARTINDYWIQTGAFSAMVRAEDAKEKLAEKGLVSLIENREVNGQLWYRVRLGPYTSEREANYWLALVQSIDGFGESQVRQTTRTQ